MKARYAEIEKKLIPSAIRTSVAYGRLPGMISFAGGSPDPATFPTQTLTELTARVMEKYGPAALTYCPSEGVSELRELIIEHMQEEGISGISKDEILVTSGSQQGLDFCGKLFLNKGDVVICENPSYLGAINAFAVYGCRFVGVDMDEEGMITEDLERALKDNPETKFIYTVPTFQNPSGKTMGQVRRQNILALAKAYEIPIVEDNPYGNIYFGDEMTLPIKHYDTDHTVIYLGTYSKTACPGLRVGWIAANTELIEKFTIMKQSADLQSSTLTQLQVYEYVRGIDWKAHTNDLRTLYRKKCRAMLASIEEHFPTSVTWTEPIGGLFIWADLPKHIKAEEVLQTAVKHGVVFVPGAPFYVDENHHNHMRLSFGTSSEEEIREGIRRLGLALKEHC